MNNIYDNTVEITGLNVVSIRNNMFDKNIWQNNWIYNGSMNIVFLLINLFYLFFSTGRMSYPEMFCKISHSSLENNGTGVSFFDEVTTCNGFLKLLGGIEKTSDLKWVDI